MKKIYVGMALTDAPEEFRTVFQHDLKTALRTIPDVAVVDFVGLENGTAPDVYLHDRKNAEECDLFIAICDHASTGLGMELAFRHVSKKPLLLFAHNDAKITRMVLGFAEQEKHPLIRYADIEDIVARVKEELSRWF